MQRHVQHVDAGPSYRQRNAPQASQIIQQAAFGITACAEDADDSHIRNVPQRNLTRID